MDLDDLINRLMKLSYRNKSDVMDFPVISSHNRNLVSDEIRSWAKAQDNNQEILKKEHEIAEINKKIGELEGKVYVYETVIANSNFAPIINS